MEHNEYLKIRRRVAEELFLKGAPTLPGNDFASYAATCISVADTFATKLRLSEVQEELAGVYEDFDHLPTLMESVDEEELLNYIQQEPQDDRDQQETL